MTASERRFRDYMHAFNASDWDALQRFYAADVELVIGNGTTLRGRDAIVDFYRDIKSWTSRTIEILDCFSDGNMLAAELESEFVALIDAPDFPTRPMQRGDRYYINSFALYDFRGSEYRRIRAAVFRREFRPLTAG